jgi:signal transduction histidine kinase
VNRAISIPRLIRGWSGRWAAVLALVALALILRQIIAHHYPGLGPFITFYPAVLLAALIEGLWAGITGTVLSALLAYYFVFHPVESFAGKAPSADINLAVFTVFGIFLSLVIERHRHNREKLAALQAEAAVAEERRKSEGERETAAVVQSERKRLLEILETLPIMTYLLTPDHQVKFANREFRKKFGDVTGRLCYESCFGKALPCEYCESFVPLKTGKPHRWEVNGPDGSIIEAYSMPFTDFDGSQMILEMNIDVTEQRRAAAQLEEYRHRLEDLVQQRTGELEVAKAEAERSAAQLKTVFENIGERLYVCDGEGNLIATNEASRQTYGRPDGTTPSVYDLDKEIEVFDLEGNPIPKEQWSVSRVLRGEKFSGLEYVVKFRRTGQLCVLRSSGSPIRDQAGKIVMAVVISADITERKQAEDALRESEEEFRVLAQNMVSGVALINAQGELSIFNPSFLRIFDLESADLPNIRSLDWNKWQVFDENGRLIDADERPIRRAVLTRTAVRDQLVAMQTPGRTDLKWLLVSAEPILDRDGNIKRTICSYHEITGLKLAESALRESEKLALHRDQLRALTERLEKAREEERTRVARDLHDDIGQILTAVKMELQWIGRHDTNKESEAHKRLKGAVELIADGIRSVREICTGLRPSLLDDMGLAAAIEWQADEFSKRTGIACRLSLEEEELGLPGDHATAFFRIFQECLTNVTRHAQAKTVDVSLFQEAEDVVLVVRDDGVGIREVDYTSLGILGMKERAQACGGELLMNGSPGDGTTVTLRVRLRPN